MWRRFARGGAALAASAALVAGGSVGIATAAQGGAGGADSFKAPLCEGTETAPADIQITLTGDRLDYYNAGHVVPLYGNGESNAWMAQHPPICGVRKVDGQPVAEWMYCTDQAKGACAGVVPEGTDWKDPATMDYSDPDFPFGTGGQTLAPGTPTNDSGSETGPMQEKGGNGKLSAEQEKIIAYLLRHPIAWEGGVHTGNGSEASRDALQNAVWCISDYDIQVNQHDPVPCDEYIGAQKQQDILAKVPNSAEPILYLTRTEPAGDETLAPGQTAKFSLTTNIYEQPLDLAVSGGADVSVCAGDAEINEDGDLVVHGTDQDDAVEVTLCVTSDQSGDVDVAVEGTPATTKSIQWNQAEPVHDYPDDMIPPIGEDRWNCQVFATWDTTTETLHSEDSVTFTDDEGPTGPEEPDNPEEPGDEGGSGSPGSSGSLGSLGSTGDAGSLGSIGTGALGSLGSAALGSLGSLGSAGSLGSLGSAGSTVPGSLGSAAVGSAALGSAGSLGAGGATTGSLGSGQPTGPTTPAPEQPETGGNGEGTGGGTTVPDTIAPQPNTPQPNTPQPNAPQGPTHGPTPHAIDGGDAGTGFGAGTGAGLALALLAVGGAGAFIAARRLRR